MQPKRSQVVAIAVAIRLASLPRGGALTLKELSELLPDRHAYVVKTVRELFVAGLVKSTFSDPVRHKLTRPAHKITMLETLEAVEGRFGHAPTVSLEGLSAEAEQRVESGVARSVDALRKQQAARRTVGFPRS